MGRVMMTDEQITNVKNWVFALRSGYYEQGRSALLTKDGKHCCLGVYCADVGLPIMDNMFVGTEGKMSIHLDDYHQKILGLDVPLTEEEFNKVSERSGFTGLPDRMSALMALNDRGGYSFNQIADFIEEHGWDGSKQVEEKATEPYREMLSV